MPRLSLASRVRVGWVGVVAGTGLALLTTAEAKATFPGSNGLIAFEYQAAISTIHSDGTNVELLAPDPDQVSQRPDWSPNGRQIAFSSSTGLGLMAVDGSNRRALPLAARSLPISGHKLSFAPDGRHVAYMRSSGFDGLSTKSEIWRARLDGAGDRRLGTGGLPEWSPDGRMIAYVRNTSHDDDRPIALMSARTGRLIRRLPAKASWLDWSPDGRRLLYSRQGRFGKPDLYVIRADGRGAPRRLTRSGFLAEHRAVWSPDGRSIAFTRAQSVEDESQTPGSIWTMRADGTHKRRLHTKSDQPISDVAWQPRPR